MEAGKVKLFLNVYDEKGEVKKTSKNKCQKGKSFFYCWWPANSR